MTCRTIIDPSKRAPANEPDWRFRGLELASKSKSSDVYVVVRLNSKAALYLRTIAFSFGRDISDMAEGYVRWAVHNDFCARGCPEWRREYMAGVMKIDDKQALVQLLDREDQPTDFYLRKELQRG